MLNVGKLFVRLTMSFDKNSSWVNRVVFIMFFYLLASFNTSVYASKNNKHSCLIQKEAGGRIEYNTRYGKNCTLLVPIVLSDRNALTEDGIENIIGKSCILSVDNIRYYTNIESLNNKKIRNDESYNIKCKTGYTTTDNKDFIYRCSNGELIFDADNSSEDEDCELIGCNEKSPIYDKNNNKIADHLYGAMFGNNGTGRNYYTYQTCFKNSSSGKKYELNSSGSGLGNVAPNDYVVCGRSGADLDEYKDELARKLTCVRSGEYEEAHWKFMYNSCDLKELESMDGVNIFLAYNGVESDLKSVMTSGAKQVRLTPYYYGSGDYRNGNYSRLYATFKKVEGSSIDGTIKIKCGTDDAWEIESSGNVEYDYTGGVQVFTLSRYGIVGPRNLKLEVWGAQGCSSGGLGGYSYGNYTATGDYLYVYVGGRAKAFNGGQKGGGGGASDIRDSSSPLTCSNSTDPRIVVAGGGGGCDGRNVCDGGGGYNSYAKDGNGSDVSLCLNSYTSTKTGLPTRGGNNDAGGGGYGICSSGLRTWGVCGEGGISPNTAEGGGGGWYGGGAGKRGTGGAGGGGAINISKVSGDYGGSSGANLGDGKARITW